MIDKLKSVLGRSWLIIFLIATFWIQVDGIAYITGLSTFVSGFVYGVCFLFPQLGLVFFVAGLISYF